MKRDFRVLMVFLGFVFLFQMGCDEQATAIRESKSELAAAAEEVIIEVEEETIVEVEEEAAVETEGQGGAEADEGKPEIRFEKVIHDFGKIGPKTKNVCEFGFENVGGGLLKITKVSKSCGCTPYTLDKKEYAPGESGTLKVKYNAGKRASTITKHLFVNSNDKANPKVELTIKGTIVMKVEHEPKKLNLVLKGENASCPEITLTSLDKQPFAVKSFKSTTNSITVDYDSSVKATKFVLKPKVDMEKLQKRPKGRIDIGLTHPECDSVTLTYETLAEFKSEPSAIIVRDAEPGKPVVREVYVLNNYGEEFEIESASSKKGIVKVLNRQQDGGRCRFELEITPPVIVGKRRFFTDKFIVNTKGGKKVEINCRGFYSSAALKASTQ